MLRFDPWSKQRAILESIRDNKRTAVRSGHGTGKTAIVARAVLWYLAAYPYSRVITTAPTWQQVQHQLWREIAVAHRAAEGFFDGALFDTRLELDADWFAIGLSTDRPERFAGHHAEHLLLVVDEASGIDEAIFEAGETFLTSANARVVLIGNPTVSSGTFHRAFHRDRDAWSRISISAFDTPAFTGEKVSDAALRRLPTREWVEDARKRWGEDSPLWQVRVLGEFPRSSDDTVCSLGRIEHAQRQTVEAGQPVVISCDPARFGSDETAVVVRRGSRVRIAATWGRTDLMQTAGRIIRIAREEAAKGVEPTIVVDDVGVGGGLVDRLRELAEFPVVSFNGAAAPRDATEYPNARSQAWFDFADRLDSIDLDDDEQLAADLLAPTYKIDSAGRRVVEPKSETKKRLGRSPDRADAVLMAFAPLSRGEAGSFSTIPRPEAEITIRRAGLTLQGARYLDRAPGPAPGLRGDGSTSAMPGRRTDHRVPPPGWTVDP
ncbi:MAG: AAA family ATPase [Thermoleophilia bacterium]